MVTVRYNFFIEVSSRLDQSLWRKVKRMWRNVWPTARKMRRSEASIYICKKGPRIRSFIPLSISRAGNVGRGATKVTGSPNGIVVRMAGFAYGEKEDNNDLNLRRATW
jgi:hypothetical protein